MGEERLSARDGGERCPNCGAAVDDRYCPHCGQSQGPLQQSFRRWLAEFLDEQFSVSGKVPQTIRTLILRPGFLTAEWLRGRRTRYVPPLRLYILSALVFFAVLTLLPLPAARTQTGISGGESNLPAGNEGRLDLSSWLDRVQNDPAYAEALVEKILENYPHAMYIVLPLLALVIMALYRGSGVYYVGHLVFTLHLQTFVFVIASPLTLVISLTADSRTLGTLIASITALGMWIYLFLALRTVYSESGARTIAKVLVIVMAETILRSLLALGMAVAFA